MAQDANSSQTKSFVASDHEGQWFVISTSTAEEQDTNEWVKTKDPVEIER